MDTIDFSHLKDEPVVQSMVAKLATDQTSGRMTPLPAGSFPKLKDTMLSRAIIEQDESSANSNLGSLSGPSEEAQGSSLVDVPEAVALSHADTIGAQKAWKEVLTPDKATATATANSTAATTTTTSGKAAQLSVAKVS